jgi:hypothetical protein
VADKIAFLEAIVKHLIQRLLCETRDGDRQNTTMEGFAYWGECIPFAEWRMNDIRMDWQKNRFRCGY